MFDDFDFFEKIDSVVSFILGSLFLAFNIFTDFFIWKWLFSDLLCFWKVFLLGGLVYIPLLILSIWSLNFILTFPYTLLDIDWYKIVIDIILFAIGIITVVIAFKQDISVFSKILYSLIVLLLEFCCLTPAINRVFDLYTDSLLSKTFMFLFVASATITFHVWLIQKNEVLGNISLLLSIIIIIGVLTPVKKYIVAIIEYF